MQDVAARLGRIKSQSFSYASADGQTRSLDRYTITVTADGATYSIDATALGDQLSDDCGSFSLDHESVWTFAGGRSYDDCN
ncbi:MAG: type IV pilin protein [Pseudomonadales bacterium]|nr:type IV pilin protein [Pseudomonadales bacterium]